MNKLIEWTTLLLDEYNKKMIHFCDIIYLYFNKCNWLKLLCCFSRTQSFSSLSLRCFVLCQVYSFYLWLDPIKTYANISHFEQADDMPLLKVKKKVIQILRVKVNSVLLMQTCLWKLLVPCVVLQWTLLRICRHRFEKAIVSATLYSATTVPQSRK